MKDSHNPNRPTDSQAPTSDRRDRLVRSLEIGFWLLAVGLGFLHAWADRHYLSNADTMSYLDIAEAYLRQDWSTAVNAYWSPLYSWLIALGLLLVRPSPYWKFTILHLVNFAIYLFALGCFAFLIRELVQLNRSLREKLLAEGLVILPGWAIGALGYPLFIWSSLYLILIAEESPDLLVASFIYLASALILHIRRQPSRWVPFLFLGITLGLGYLAKSVMLPMALVFLGAAMFSVGSLRRALPRISLAVVLFILLAGPFVISISRAKGRLTFGDTGKLNYLWSINRLPSTHWQGGPGDYGQPRHPSRKVFNAPPIYEFGYPVGGTYPVWYDPTYWYEGGVSRFDLRQQVRVFGTAVQSYYELFHKWGLQYGLLTGLLTLYLMGHRGRLTLRDLAPLWSLIIPASVGIGLYSLVSVQGRYVASFFVLLWLALFSGVRLHNLPGADRLIKSITIILMSIMIFTSVASSSREAVLTARSLLGGEDPTIHDQWQVAEGLRAVGMSPGDKVAVIGYPVRAFWAHLADLRIIAELDGDDAGSFWEGNSTLKTQVIQAFAGTGSKAIVAERPPSGVDLTGWRKIGNTDYYVYLLKT